MPDLPSMHIMQAGDTWPSYTLGVSAFFMHDTPLMFHSTQAIKDSPSEKDAKNGGP
jgi:hypothetical protein